MNDRTWLEARVARLVSTLADEAPTDVDPLAMARLAATEAGVRRRVAWPVIGLRDAYPAWVLLLGALLVAMIGAMLVAGGRFTHRPADDLVPPRPLVDPFVGIAPAWAEPSQADDVDLIVSFNARLTHTAIGHYWFWLFSDGRIVWLSEGGNDGRAPRGSLVEQRLTPAGVTALASWVAANSEPVPGRVTWAGVEFTGGAGVLWGGLTVDVDGRRTVSTWTDATLPQRLVDPAWWLPASAWEDPTVRGYVPSRYAICTWVDGVGMEPSLALATRHVLPNDLEAAVQAGSVGRAPEGDDPACRGVPGGIARAIFAALPADRLEGTDVGPRFDLVVTDSRGPDDPTGIVRRIILDISPMVPSGDVVCNCG